VASTGPFGSGPPFALPFVAANNGGTSPGQQGVFGLNPLMTPKYAKWQPRDAEYKDTLARLYISLPTLGDGSVDPAVRTAFLNSLPSDPATKALAQVMIAGPGGGTGFVDFFLSQASERFQEVVQLDKVLSDDYVAFFFGQEPPRFEYSGFLLNSLQDDQRSGFLRAYSALLRGTQLARRGALARLRYDSVIVSGTMLAHQQTLNADNELAVPFSFSFLVKDYVIQTNLPFAKVNQSQYVQLAADLAVANLSSIGTVQTKGVTAVAVPPPIPAATSTAGAAQNTNVVDASQTAQQQTVAAANAASQPPSPTSNIRGNINPGAPVPPPSFATGFE
jgi:hypothetical protein